MNDKRISFFRQYLGYTGGHQKVRDYLEHFLAMGWRPSLHVEGQALTNSNLFENIAGVEYQDNYDPSDFDVVFLAGMDWKYFLPHRHSGHTVINLIQHVRHGDEKEALFKYLREPAIRLCVSQAVKDAIEPYANGPCHVVKMGHNLPRIKKAVNKVDLYILANKQPQLGRALASWATEIGYTVKIHTQTTDTQDVHSAMASATITIALPNVTEGFYLPGIEGMWLSDWVIVPDCIANKEYSSKVANITIPSYTLDDIQTSLIKVGKHSSLRIRMSKLFGRKIALAYSIDNERSILNAYLSKYFPE